jgi:hypothetical protein
MILRNQKIKKIENEKINDQKQEYLNEKLLLIQLCLLEQKYEFELIIKLMIVIIVIIVMVHH